MTAADAGGTGGITAADAGGLGDHVSDGRSAEADGWGARALRLRYAGTVALDDISLAVPPGQVTAVVGGDGAGKSSLLRCLAGAIRPDSGEVSGPGPLHTGYLPASSGLYPDLTVTENLLFRARAYGVPDAAAQPRIAELTELAGLGAARDRLAGQLSGGMRQKLGVIAALVHEPALVILDEPSTGVDPVSRSGLWSLIASAAAGGAAVVLATTYLDDAQRASWVLVLDAGRHIAAGAPEQIVAAMPGTVVESTAQPAGADSARSWRRGALWRTWCPPGASQPGPAVTADLQDAVTVAALAREVAAVQAAADAPPWVPSSYPHGGTNSAPMKPTSARLAEAAHVICRFGPVTAVRDVSIDVRPGEIVGLIGANGAGKTTLIRMLIGLIPATSGQVRLLGEPPSRRTRRRIGYVPQSLGLYDDLTVAENLAFASAVFGTAGSQRGRPAGPRSGRGVPVGELPLGLQRRAAFAQALAHDPELLILDEPTSGVDPLGRARLWQTIAAAVRAGAGALVSTHYMEEAGECDRLIIMADGEVVADGIAADIVGTTQVTVVEAASWADAFSRLKQAGLPVALAGRTLRLPGISPADAERALTSQPAGQSGRAGATDFRVYSAPATLEERFFELAGTARPAQQTSVPA
jgi:ABC-2 type transport system ATP-binding protein